MTPARLAPLLPLTILALTTRVAHAGGPPGACGECFASPPPAAPGAPRPAGLAQRLSIGLNLGSLSLAPAQASDAVTRFSLAGLALRFRLTRALELEGAASGGREQLDGGGAGDLAFSIVDVGARYHVQPAAAWDLYAVAGLGVLGVGSHATGETYGRARGTFHLGVGVERRFARFGLGAELRMIGVGEDTRQDTPAVQPVPGTPDVPPGMVPVDPPVAPAMGLSSSAYSGGQLTVGGSFHF